MKPVRGGRGERRRKGRKEGRGKVVSCPAHMRHPVRNSLVNKVKFLVLIPKK